VLRQAFGGTLLVVLEILVAADPIRTVAVASTLDNVLRLGLIVSVVRAPRGASALTVAELRLLPLPSTHLSFPESAEQRFLSRNTIKSETNSIYRKLGLSSRSEAISRSVELGLLTG